MLRFLLPLVLLVFTQVSLAQSGEGSAAREQLRTQKSALMKAAMNLTGEQSEKFWPIYNEYEDKLEDIIDSRLELIRLYAGNYKIMTEDKAKTLARTSFELEASRMDLRESYYKKMARGLNPIIAVRFAQVDNQINTLLDLEIMQMVPLIATPEELGLPPAQAD